MNLTPEMQIAIYLNNHPPEVALAGIRVYLGGGLRDRLSHLHWVPYDNPPDDPMMLRIQVDGQWWAPDPTYRKEALQFWSDKEKRHMELFKKNEEGVLISGKICPKCGSAMMLRGVYIHCPKSNPNFWNSHWYCSNDDCTQEFYSKRTAESILNHWELFQEIDDGL